jgi:OmpA-OmpF porin, OOP family
MSMTARTVAVVRSPHRRIRSDFLHGEFKMKSFARILVATAALAASSTVLAQAPAAPPWYVGVGAGGGHLSKSAGDLTGLNNATLDNRDTTYTVRGGWRFSPFAAAELGYYDFGRYEFSGTAVGNAVPINGSARGQSFGISLVGILPIRTVDIYGRIGYAYSELKLNANASLGTANQNDRQSEATYGAGLRWRFAPNWGLFAEWVKNDRISVDSYVGGIDIMF